MQTDLSKPLTVEMIDFSAGALIPFYDHDTKMIYLAGKVTKNIQFISFFSFSHLFRECRAMEIFVITN